MLILKPVGRGNWATLKLIVEGRHTAPLLVRKGQTITLGGAVYRICEVHP